MLSALMLAAAISGLPAPVSGDFDHDGKPDTAEVIIAGRNVWELIVRPGNKRRHIAVIERYWNGKPRDAYLAIEPPGRLKTWCGRGGGSDTDPCPYKVVTLRGKTLAFGTKEASESVALWNGRRYVTVLISD